MGLEIRRCPERKFVVSRPGKRLKVAGGGRREEKEISRTL